MYVRGSDQDYDDWAAIVGDPSWGSSAMKQYMRKHQTLEPIDEAIIDRTTMPFVGENHGTSGPVRTSFNDFQLPLDNDVINACDDVTGISKKPTDPWSGDHIGFFNTLGSVVRSGPDRGKRSYAARGYLGQSDGRPNLKILCEAQVTGITLDGNTAKGVNFTHGGTQHSINVTKEVILCGGAIHSPQILELSGIGDPKVLEAAGIPCKINLPGVGNSYQDHSLTGGCWEVAPGVQCMDAFHIPEVMAEAQKALMEKQGGPLTCIASCQGFFPYKLLVSDAELKETVQSIRETAAKASPFQKKQLEQVIAHLESSKSANLQFVLVPATPDFVEGVQDQAKLFPPPPEPGKNMGVTLVICLEYPASRGSIHVTSSGEKSRREWALLSLTYFPDPTQPPVIDPAYADHPADIAVLAAGLKFLDSVAKSKPLEGKLVSRVFPNPDLDLQNLNDSRKAVQELILGEYHSCGSCPMGDVVDSHLRVNGVQGLRVADASVFPNHVSGNICSSVDFPKPSIEIQLF